MRVPNSILALSLLFVFPVLAENTVKEGDFESPGLRIASHTAPELWNAYIHGEPSDAAVSIVEGAGRNGSRGVRYSKTSAGNQNIHLDQILEVSPDTFYQVRAWMRGDGTLDPMLSVMAMDWSPLASVCPGVGAEWTEATLLFHSGTHERVRLQWFPGSDGKLYRGVAGTCHLDDVTVVPVAELPESVRRALTLSHPPRRELDVSAVVPGPVGNPLPLRPIRARNGVLVYKDGGEVALWGVNLQTALNWEYLNRMRHCGIPLEAEALKDIADRNIAELKTLGLGIVRMHLLPSDFSDGEGNIRESVFLDVLDYTMHRCNEAGIYVYLTLINEMSTKFFPDSFLVGREHPEWTGDPELVRISEHYVQEFLSRTNRYSGVRYADDPSLAIIELINEPRYADYAAMRSNPKFGVIRQQFEVWLAERGLSDYPDLHYHTFRYEQISAYLARMHAAVRVTGALQPVAWNLNWPRFVRDHEDVYQAVADSPLEVVSFCLYPGQGDVPSPYWDNPRDLGDKNYLPYLSEVAHDYGKLRWLLGERFAGKAKAVYEFETFYNQSSYLYPAMAAVFRSLGAQTAQMWTYTLTPTAEHYAGSHFLNLQTTPAKATSFAIAGETFKSLPRYTPYPVEVVDPMVFGPCTLSFEQDASVFAAPEVFMHAKPVAQGGPANPRLILARGSSPLVTYDGTGIYRIDIGVDAIDLVIQPDAEFVYPHWNRKGRSSPWSRTCALDYEARHRFALRLDEWRGPVGIWRIEDGKRLPVSPAGSGIDFEACPGRYRIERLP
jgi:hypothetical protein